MFGRKSPWEAVVVLVLLTVGGLALFQGVIKPIIASTQVNSASKAMEPKRQP